MTTAASVPRTHGELEGDEAIDTLRRLGRRRLVLDAAVRFRAADGFSHSRALAFQITLTLLPALIAVVGLAEALGQETFRPLAGTIGVLLWSFLTSIALFLGLAFAAQLEAVRAGAPGPRADRDEDAAAAPD